MNTNRWLDGLSIVYGRYIGLGINYWPDPNNRNANERSMSQSSDIARKGGFLQRPSIINWDFFVFECNATGRKHVYLSSFGTWMSGWVDDGTFGKHLPPQPGKSHPSDRARGDKEDRARLQIRADNWHKNEKFAFIFYVFVAYTAHMGVHRWILRQCTDRCRESWESQSGAVESCEQCAGINILSCAGINILRHQRMLLKSSGILSKDYQCSGWGELPWSFLRGFSTFKQARLN